MQKPALYSPSRSVRGEPTVRVRLISPDENHNDSSRPRSQKKFVFPLQRVPVIEFVSMRRAASRELSGVAIF
ncbi:MAG TPA: hypothetical protein VH062_27400 [Polyangiaceae bacterium]|jgi:hypothetical protein|nr:hypothetical protein [Polyangiaceae bacterium]